MSVSCRRCGVPVPAEKRECQACAEDNGFPNVRLAEAPGEQDALTQRLRDAERSVEERGCKETLDRFGHAVLLDSRAVMRLSGISCLGGHDGWKGAQPCRDAKSLIFLMP